jgi:FdhD protein
MVGRVGSRTKTRIAAVDDGSEKFRSDYVATEEPLEIRLSAGGRAETVAVTMRTPGSDFELAAGWLFSEGVLGAVDSIRRITYCTDPGIDADQRFNIVNVELASGLAPDLAPLERHFHITSACGVCGKATLESLRLRGMQPVASGPTVDRDVVSTLPEKLRAAQGLFDSTGGLHAAGLFDAGGALLVAREDVGRHNAVDKLIGWAVLEQTIPLRERILLVSGRSSFEIMQKAAAAGISVVCAVSAPSSLAVQVAQEFGQTLIGFLRGRRFNVYAGRERLEAIEGERA